MAIGRSRAALAAILAATSVVAGVVTVPGQAADAPTPAVVAPRLSYAFTIRAELAPPIEQGVVDGKRMRFVPITGGTVSGPRLNGVVLPGGGDWQALHPDGLTEVNTHYALKTADGVVIDIANPGVRVASAEVAARLARGEPVDAGLYYFRSTPRLTAPAGAYDWLRRTVFVGRGIRRPDHVEIAVFAVE